MSLVGVSAAIAIAAPSIAAPQTEADPDTHPQNQKYQTTAGDGLTHVSAASSPIPSTQTQNATSTTTPRPRMAQTDTSVEHLRDREPVSLQAAELLPQVPSVETSGTTLPQLTAEAQPALDTAEAQDDTAPPDQNNLAQESQNPIGDLISLPFQFNFNFGVGPFDKTQLVVNIQPVVPISLGPNWTLVTRTIIPLVNQPTVAVRAPSAPGLPPMLESDSQFGLGDINPQFFFVPKGTGKVNFGIGPQFIFPTATADATGTG